MRFFRVHHGDPTWVPGDIAGDYNDVLRWPSPSTVGTATWFIWDPNIHQDILILLLIPRYPPWHCNRYEPCISLWTLEDYTHRSRRSWSSSSSRSSVAELWLSVTRLSWARIENETNSDPRPGSVGFTPAWTWNTYRGYCLDWSGLPRGCYECHWRSESMPPTLTLWRCLIGSSEFCIQFPAPVWIKVLNCPWAEPKTGSQPQLISFSFDLTKTNTLRDKRLVRDTR